MRRPFPVTSRNWPSWSRPALWIVRMSGTPMPQQHAKQACRTRCLRPFETNNACLPWHRMKRPWWPMGLSSFRPIGYLLRPFRLPWINLVLNTALQEGTCDITPFSLLHCRVNSYRLTWRK